MTDPSSLQMLEMAIKLIPDEYAIIKGRMLIDLSTDKEWLKEYGKAAYVAWFVLSVAKYAPPGLIAAIGVIMIVGNDVKSYQITRDYCPIHAPYLDIRQECENLDSDIAAMCEAIHSFRVFSGYSLIAGMQLEQISIDWNPSTS